MIPNFIREYMLTFKSKHLGIYWYNNLATCSDQLHLLVRADGILEQLKFISKEG